MVEDLNSLKAGSQGMSSSDDSKDTSDDNYEDHDRYLMKKIEEGIFYSEKNHHHDVMNNNNLKDSRSEDDEDEDDEEDDDELIDDDLNTLRGKWTALEDELLKVAVKEYGGKNWRRIASRIEGRTDVQCLHRWQKVLRPGLVKGPWTKEVRFNSFLYTSVFSLY